MVNITHPGLPDAAGLADPAHVRQVACPVGAALGLLAARGALPGPGRVLGGVAGVSAVGVVLAGPVAAQVVLRVADAGEAEAVGAGRVRVEERHAALDVAAVVDHDAVEAVAVPGWVGAGLGGVVGRVFVGSSGGHGVVVVVGGGG
ncbi:uncharacterized protein PG986_013041 [Apiospora aurea]|uniref:Uncharacterized protein n=1 Tax=Apiospora aurea TaxID=335848 RepID=A0ABR1Q1R1_9PEZI